MKRPIRTTTYVVTTTITVEEQLDSSWHKPFNARDRKRLVRDLVPKKGSFITGGAYTAEVKRVEVN